MFVAGISGKARILFLSIGASWLVPLWLMRYISAAIYVVLGVANLAETAGYLG